MKRAKRIFKDVLAAGVVIAIIGGIATVIVFMMLSDDLPDTQVITKTAPDGARVHCLVIKYASGNLDWKCDWNGPRP